mmetsp:Transcript_77296/g.221389  ORF Transcript_77296/g.221389 Transcript_77296/m.221389 type:complete len:201 (+) Transcript_77296:140-742(+)
MCRGAFPPTSLPTVCATTSRPMGGVAKQTPALLHMACRSFTQTCRCSLFNPSLCRKEKAKGSKKVPQGRNCRIPRPSRGVPMLLLLKSVRGLHSMSAPRSLSRCSRVMKLVRTQIIHRRTRRTMMRRRMSPVLPTRGLQQPWILVQQLLPRAPGRIRTRLIHDGPSQHLCSWMSRPRWGRHRQQCQQLWSFLLRPPHIGS